ncbi:Carbon starvation protein CstA [Humidesulfovibrio mexicanus]|uniref:Carbon starvation protein CstA n=1 Tax=Humidesulfovibrio mexicanus TaxID=147047 RepID=A0A238Y842_9BACT|nr:carbon starvation protein A [Humidesulfovibrio mexicanus]SNR67395.1 Carbon starvation protein CstA [Humidesulfovibrio mexicanus]
MMIFLLCTAALIVGYFTYGAMVDKLFQPDVSRTTPAMCMADGVDYVPMSKPKIFLIQLLNIAGLGPVFGPILGALYGPAALVWIVIGTIVAGGVHDYFSGMLSLRYRGESIPDVVGYNLGNGFKQFMRLFSLILLLLVGVVFVLGPAKLLGKLSGIEVGLWVAAIFAYYFLATILPIDKIIGRLYPVFGAILIFMAVAMPLALMNEGYNMFPNLTLANLHPKELPMWPLMFITIACGAISGFHSTQSPLMSRCVCNEREGRFIFYGAMVAEGFIGLVWATVGMSFYQTPEALNAALAAGGPANVVNEACTTLLGGFGGVLAILGVVVLPITSGDTAFRAARLLIADFAKYSQKQAVKRLYIAVPLFVVGYVISLANFDVIWRYFGWANQSLAAIVLWTAAAYCVKHGKPHWIATVPAVFMTAVSNTFILNATIGFNLPLSVSTPIGVASSVAALAAFLYVFRSSNLAKMEPDNA